MAFPSVAAADSKNGAQTTNSTSWSLTYPTNIAANDLLLAFIATDGSQTTGGTTWPADWVKSPVDLASGSAATLLSAKKKATGSETGTFSVTMATEQGAWRVIRIPASGWEGTLGTTYDNAVDAGAVCKGAGTTGSSFGTNAAPDATSFDPNNWGAEDTLWIAVAAWDNTPTCTAFPTGFTQEDHSTAGGHTQTSGGSGGAGLAICYRKENVSSKDVAAFTLSGADDWRAVTFAIRPSSGATTGTLAASTAGNYS